MEIAQFRIAQFVLQGSFAASELLTAALADRLSAVDAYVAPVAFTAEQRVIPGNLRERIRCDGPTVALPGAS